MYKIYRQNSQGPRYYRIGHWDDNKKVQGGQDQYHKRTKDFSSFQATNKRN